MKTPLLLFTLFITLFFASDSSSQNVHRWYQDGKIIFQVKDSKNVPFYNRGKYVEVKSVDFLQNYLGEYKVTSLRQLFPNHEDSKLSRTFELSFDEVMKVDEFIRELSKNSLFAYVEKKEHHELMYTPNDQFYNSSFSNGQWNLFQINAAQAWDIFKGDSNTIIAVTDNAINVDHPDLKNKMIQGYDAADQDNDPRGCGTNTGLHGSHVSGTVASETDNGIGVASIGFNCKIMPIKIGNCNGQLTGGYEGIVWAADRGAQVINASWGGAGASTFGQNVCNYAWNKGSILVVAAGNDNVSTQFYPAAYNNSISVAATTQGDVKSSFSNYGTWIDIAAPGSSILSTNTGTGNGYAFLQGTSMASPLVAGLVGLMRSYAPNATQLDIVNCLLSSADNIDSQNTGYSGKLGAGRINAFAAMQCLSSFSKSLDLGIEEVVSPKESICGTSINPEVEIRNYGSNAVTQFTLSYNIIGGAVQTFTWSGSLASGQTVNVSLPAMNGLVSGANVFNVTVSNPNGQQDEHAPNDTKSQSFFVASNGDQVVFTLNLDCFGNDNSWEIVDKSSGTAVIERGPYTNNVNGENKTYTICLAPGCYTFKMTDAYGDGLYGSQHTGECTINGDYNLKDSQGNTLFAMTAANGAFGGSVTHDFCIIDRNVNEDVGVDIINEPKRYLCGGTQIDPQVTIRNYGIVPLTSTIINYKVNNGPVQTFNWSGNLASGATQLVTLAGISGVSGINLLTVYTTQPNGLTDPNNINDTAKTSVLVSGSGLSLPFKEDFETNSQIWMIENPDNDVTWSLSTTSGNGGTSSAGINLFAYSQQGKRDGLLSSPISFAGQTSVSMDFEHAYRRYDQMSTDSLIVYISKDCGLTFERVLTKGEDATGSFATASTSTTSFIPQQASDWCLTGVGSSCYTIDLSAYAGEANVIVKFESFNAGTTGNNLFIDNINIKGNIITDIEDVATPKLSIYPNPSTGLINIVGSEDINEQLITVYSMVGDQVAVSVNKITNNHARIDLGGVAKGIYYVNYMSNGKSLVEKLVIQ